jgi:hypothetical protein
MEQGGNGIQTEIASGLKPLVPQGGIIASGAKQSAFTPFGAKVFPKIWATSPHDLNRTDPTILQKRGYETISSIRCVVVVKNFILQIFYPVP